MLTLEYLFLGWQIGSCSEKNKDGSVTLSDYVYHDDAKVGICLEECFKLGCLQNKPGSEAHIPEPCGYKKGRCTIPSHPLNAKCELLSG